MRRINLASYSIQNPDGQSTDEKLAPEMVYNVRDSAVEVLFHPSLQLGGKDVLDRDDLARKIEHWPDTDLLLEEAEYTKLLAGVNAVRGLTRRDVEFVKRVLNAPQVEVQSKTEQPSAKE